MILVKLILNRLKKHRRCKVSQTNKLYEAAVHKYQAQKSEALAHLEILFNNSVGIGEHTDILTEVDKWLNNFSQAEENLNSLKKLLK